MDGYLLAFAVLGLAAFAQTVAGFGFALIAVPLLSAVGPARTAVVAVTLVSLALTAVTTAAERRQVSWPVTLRLCVPAVLGMPLGLVALARLPDALLGAVIAVVVCGSSLAVWRGWRLRPTAGRIGAIGFLSGVLLTSTGTNGPPLVACLQALRLDPRGFRATSAAALTLSGAVGVAGFLAAGQISAGAWALSGTGLAACAVGGLLGNLVFRRIDAAGFRRIVLSALLVSALVAVAGAALG
ncbi:sulfite exporter TauE/SafE family protein [Streptacidiphilus cavernicola]|uniref:Probable membrane transporter protein n=1 Tax=Streptacidiphilus cavernicola TaxID=3342716 RepID=A0ABV6VMU1_9ACTN